MNNTGVGWIGRYLEEILAQSSRNLRAKAAIANRLSRRLIKIFWRPHIPVFKMDLPTSQGEGANHAIAIKPVSVLGLADPLATRTISEKSAHQVRGHFAFNLVYNVIVLLVQILKPTVTRWEFIHA
jgi:hypothetical protein